MISLTEQEAVQLHESLSKIGTFDVIFRMEEVTSSQIDLLANTLFHDAPDIITFVVLCRWESSQQFLKQVFNFYFFTILLTHVIFIVALFSSHHL